MRMAELSAATGVPVPTIKYYIREGLVPAGRSVGRNQAAYDDSHVRKLRLVRSLAEYGGLTIAMIGELVRLLDDPDTDLFRLFGTAQNTITEERETRPGPHRDKAERIVADLVARRGWHCDLSDPAARTAVGVLATLSEVGLEDMIDRLDDYAAAVERIAEIDIDVLGDVEDRERAVEVVVVATVLGDPLFAALRRLTQASVSRRVYKLDKSPR